VHWVRRRRRRRSCGRGQKINWPAGVDALMRCVRWPKQPKLHASHVRRAAPQKAVPLTSLADRITSHAHYAGALNFSFKPPAYSEDNRRDGFPCLVWLVDKPQGFAPTIDTEILKRLRRDCGPTAKSSVTNFASNSAPRALGAFQNIYQACEFDMHTVLRNLHLLILNVSPLSTCLSHITNSHSRRDKT
jgi:hypothetical protein